MIKIEVNKTAPKEIHNLLIKEGFDSRAFMVYEDSITVYIVAEKLRKGEINRFNSSLKIGVAKFEKLDFFMLEIDDNLGFDVPILFQNLPPNFKADTLGNLCTIILLDSNRVTGQFFVRGLRALGFSPAIMAGIKEGLNKKLDRGDLFPYVNNIYRQYDKNDLFRKATIKQSFKK